MGKHFPFIEKIKLFLSIVVTLTQRWPNIVSFLKCTYICVTLAQRRRFPKMFIHVYNVGPTLGQR